MGKFVCGFPLCGNCTYRMTDEVGYFGFYLHEHVPKQTVLNNGEK